MNNQIKLGTRVGLFLDNLQQRSKNPMMANLWEPVVDVLRENRKIVTKSGTDKVPSKSHQLSKSKQQIVTLKRALNNAMRRISKDKGENAQLRTQVSAVRQEYRKAWYAHKREEKTGGGKMDMKS